MRIAGVDREVPHLRDEVVVARALQRLTNSRIVGDPAHRCHDIRQPEIPQRTERDLHHHFSAVATAGDKFSVRSHGAGPRFAGVDATIVGVARSHALGDQRFDRQAGQLGRRVTEQARRRRVGERNDAMAIDQQEGVRIRREERAIDSTFFEPDRQFLVVVHAGVTHGTNR